MNSSRARLRLRLSYGLIFCLVFIAHLTQFPGLFLSVYQVQWMLLLPLVVGYFYGRKRAIIFALPCGILSDLLSASTWGTSLCLCLCGALLIDKGLTKRFERSWLVFLPSIAGVRLVQMLVEAVVLCIRWRITAVSLKAGLWQVIKDIPVQLFIDLAGALLIAVVLVKWFRPEEIKSVYSEGEMQ